ncbi:hypothetical protein PLICRDRAFT_181203, partial [Plicaturopsis crispa FD-325 SS-3]
PAHRLTTTAPARIHAQRAHRSYQAALGVPTAIATPTPLPRPRHVTAYPNDTHLRAHLRAPPPLFLPTTFNHTPLISASRSGPGTLPPRQTEHRDAGRPQHAPSWTATNDERRVPVSRETQGRRGMEGREGMGSGYDGERRASSPSFDAVPAGPVGKRHGRAAQRSRVPRGRCTRAANDAPALDVPAFALPALDDLRGRPPRACRPRARRPRARRPRARRSPRTPSPRLPSTRSPSPRSTIPADVLPAFVALAVPALAVPVSTPPRPPFHHALAVSHTPPPALTFPCIPPSWVSQ